MPDQLDPQIIDRYLAGEASLDERARVEAQRIANPAWAATVDAIADAVKTHPSRPWDVDAAWSKLQLEKPRSSKIRVAWLAAAGLLLAVGATTWFVARNHTAVTAPTTFAHEIVTPNGARQTFTLDDGSRVTLNAGSRLRWAKDFGIGARDVYLDGEAYFVITHDSARPFRVHARGAIAHDLGTRFTVRAYAELPELEVAVAEGSVSLRRDRSEARDSAIIVVGQLGRLGAAGSPTIESNIAVDRWTAWTGGSLVLEGLTLRQALPQLERWYNATITVTDSQLANRRLSARFHDETLPQMLDALTLALGARWEKQGRSITLTPLKP